MSIRLSLMPLHRFRQLLQRWIPAVKKQNLPAEPEDFSSTELIFASTPAGVTKLELALHRIDLLNDCQMRIELGLTMDRAFCEKFGILVEAILAEAIGTNALTTHEVEMMTNLAVAGRSGNVVEIRLFFLPYVYEAMILELWKGVKDEGGSQSYGTQAHDLQERKERLRVTLLRLKTALGKGDNESADAAMAELRSMEYLTGLPNLYSFLHTTLLMGEMKIAAEMLAMWLKNKVRPL